MFQKRISIFTNIMTITFLVMISFAGQAEELPVINYASSISLGKGSDLCQSEGFDHKTTICIDSSDPRAYIASLTYVCIINSKYKGKIPPDIKNNCQGKTHSVNYGQAGLLTVTIGDKDTPQPALFTQLSFTFGNCSQSYNGNGLFNLVGTIYSCDEKSNTFILHK